ncbi:hypothetical protein PACTADRAFT_48835 [Pachysolen tannophilus NRRL Y-2460]|uniref:Phosphatidylethanolamine N-methyltransferase n=1 Tax=Pachysolen tannophilus NRRL Y-2460 TaxID=669874 RepID=A0A1E4TZ97_PACTA|nr:hypothetical protein PACTADRAFT_48835 [Pachysolen tannophilus NRRL Y-2460]
MNDFTTYMLLVLSCSSSSIDLNNPILTLIRWSLGIFCFIFNLIVKLNAHKIVKDYAWYWGDFFYRLADNKELIFDGVFDLAPHPMYSIGYAGYYGFALMTKSYTILFISIFGHICQLLFLKIVETPHIEKIYGDPSAGDSSNHQFIMKRDDDVFDGDKPLLIFNNFKIIRSTDWLTLIMSFLLLLIGISIWAETPLYWLTLLITMGSNLIIISILYFQSNFKSFTLMNLKANEGIIELNSTEDIEISAFKNWSILYNNLIVIKYTSIFALALRKLIDGKLFKDNYWVPLRISICIVFIMSQYLMNQGIIDSIGKFGWFYGDFFMISSITKHKYVNKTLSRSGIYHFLNQPERISSLLTIYGLAILFNSSQFLIISIMWTFSNIILLSFIERQHMIKIYGESNVLQKSGVSKSLKQLFIPKPVQGKIDHIGGSMDKIIDDTSKIVNEFIRTRKFSNENLVDPNQDHFKLIRSNSHSKLTIIRDNYKANSSPEDAILEENEDEEEALLEEDKSKSTVVELLNYSKDTQNLTYYYNIGDPIRASWKSPTNTSKSWIGLYKILSTSKSRLTTLISSSNYWVGLHKDGYDEEFRKKFVIEENKDNGIIEFSGNLLYHEPGIYELRYYNDASHDVGYITEPFEIRIPKLVIPKADADIPHFNNQLLNKIFNKLIVNPEKKLKDINDSLNYKNAINDKKFLGKLVQTLSSSIDYKISVNLILKSKNLNDLGSKIIEIKKLVDGLTNDNI